MNRILKAGFGRTDVTPELGVRLGGYGVKERPAEEIFDRLHSTAMVLEQDGVSAAVVNLDWICIEEDIVERIRCGVNQRTGIPEKNVSVFTTHSHSVPNTLNFWGWGERENAYIDSILPEVIRSVELAKENLQEVETGIAVTESLTGVNRRGIEEDGSICFHADPNGMFDPIMTVMHFRNKSDDVGILVHYGAHGTAMGSNRLVSRDWCGVMKDRIESQFNAPVLFLNGAIGDVGPRTNFRVCRTDNRLSAGVGDGIHAVREVGYRAATDAIRVLLSIREWRSELKLEVFTEDIFLPYAPLTPLADAERELEKWESHKTEWGTPMCEYMHNSAVIEAHKIPLLNGRNFTQTITRIGPLAIVPMPGEMFSGISLRIRQGSPFQYTLCCSVSNDSVSYLPTREARHRGGYECWVGKAASAYLLADNIDDALVEQNLGLLRKISEC
jgi:hypothetical protein